MIEPGDGQRAALLGALSAAPGRVRDAAVRAESLTAGRAGTRDEGWSPAEVVRHLIACERDVFQQRLAQLAAERDGEPRWSWVEPGPDEASAGRPLDDLLEEFAAARSATLAVTSALDEAGWARVGIHATLGRLDVAGLLRVARDHDEEHLADLESRLDR